MTWPSSPVFFHLPQRLEDALDGREEEVRRGEDEVDIRVRGHRRLEAGKRHLRVPLGVDLGRRLEDVGMGVDRVHEAFAPLHRVRVGKVADEDQRMELLAGRLELRLGLDRHRLDRQTRHRLVVGDDDDALGEVGGRAIEGRDRHVGFLRQRHQHRFRIAVICGQDDAVGALSDAVLDLLELPVGVLAAVQFDHLDAVLGQRADDGGMTRAPEAGRKILEGVADLLGSAASARCRRSKEVRSPPLRPRVSEASCSCCPPVSILLRCQDFPFPRAVVLRPGSKLRRATFQEW